MILFKQEPSLDFFNRNHRSTVFTGNPCSVTAICLLCSTVFFDNQSELRVTLAQSGSWTFYLYSRKLVSHPYGGHELLPHEYWASVDESLLPLNSRRVRFLVLGSLSRPMHSTTKFEKLFQFKCVYFCTVDSLSNWSHGSGIYSWGAAAAGIVVV